MDIWHIKGKKKLEGTCYVQGSKNASLPILAASIIAPGITELSNVPMLRDVDAAMCILKHLGCSVSQNSGEICINSVNVGECEIPHLLMEKMRSSVIFMCALLARCGEARLSLPGGCQLGERPIDLHIKALRQMGAEIDENGREIYCRAEKLQGAVINLPFPSVGATENIMLAATAAVGETVIHGAAREPEIVELQRYLNSFGAEISGAGSGTVRISGFEARKHVVHRIAPDRIVASTTACAAAAAGGNVEIRGIEPEHFSTVLYFLKRAGCDIIIKHDVTRIHANGRLRAVGELSTEPYPGFPTDAQPVLMAAMLKAKGITAINETIFENRYRQVPELLKLGADIKVSGRKAVIRGVDELYGSTLTSTDLRGGAAMIIAGLSAEGETLLFDDGHVSRGYENYDTLLKSLGADVYIEG